MPDILARTDDVMTSDQLRELFGDDYVPPVGNVIQTCSGAWQKEPDGRWRWWQDPDWFDDEPIDPRKRTHNPNGVFEPEDWGPDDA